MGKNKSHEKQKSQDDSNSTKSNFDIISRIFGPVKILLRMHMRVAGMELKKDARRFVSGIVTLVLFLFFITCFFMVIHFVGYFLLRKFLFPDSTLYAVLFVSGVDLVLAIMFILMTNGSFKKPFLSETKKVLSETIKDLK